MPATPAGLPFVKPEDYQYFAPLLKEDDEFEDITPEEARLTWPTCRRRARAPCPVPCHVPCSVSCPVPVPRAVSRAVPTQCTRSAHARARAVHACSARR